MLGQVPGLRATTASGAPTVPALTASRSAIVDGMKRTGKAVCSLTPLRSQASTIAWASATVVASGFSQSTCLPALAAAIVCFGVVDVLRADDHGIDVVTGQQRVEFGLEIGSEPCPRLRRQSSGSASQTAEMLTPGRVSAPAAKP